VAVTITPKAKKNIPDGRQGTVFTRVICALFSNFAAEKSGCVKYADLFRII
jgi:hypothetical protein